MKAICKVCGKEVEIYNYREKTFKYCSLNCRDKGKGKRIKKICQQCGNKFEVDIWRMDFAKYCSHKCYSLSKIGLKKTEETRRRMSESKKVITRTESHCKNISDALKGKKQSEETKIKRKESYSGDKAYNWKGENVSYRTLHNWINSLLGKASKCSICGKEGIGRQIHWANIDHRYRRVKEDYFEACTKCHGEYDKINKLRLHKHLH
jgi:hypothetical protein